MVPTAMEMQQIRYFLALADTLNFTRAAENCNVAQPSLTRAIKSLEDELGGPLFHRERNRSHLTDLGRLMHPYLEQVYANTEAAKVRAKDFTTLKDAPLTLGVMCTIGPIMLVDLISRYRDRNPGIDVRLRDGSGMQLVEHLANGKIDIAIVGLPDGIDDRFHAMRLFDERFFIAVAPGHRFEKMAAVRVGDLHGERYLNRTSCEFYDHVGDIFRQQGVEVDCPYRSERDDWIQGMVLSGLGFGFMPEYAITAPGLVIRPMIEPEVTRTINLVTVRGRPHSPAVGALVREAMTFKWTT